MGLNLGAGAQALPMHLLIAQLLPACNDFKTVKSITPSQSTLIDPRLCRHWQNTLSYVAQNYGWISLQASCSALSLNLVSLNLSLNLSLHLSLACSQGRRRAVRSLGSTFCDVNVWPNGISSDVCESGMDTVYHPVGTAQKRRPMHWLWLRAMWDWRSISCKIWVVPSATQAETLVGMAVTFAVLHLAVVEGLRVSEIAFDWVSEMALTIVVE